jgi:hypothetical protein
MKGHIMLRITDKSFRYTPSFETDLRKKFRKMERDRRDAAERLKNLEVTTVNGSVVPLDTRRSALKT